MNRILVRQTQESDFPAIIRLCSRVYPHSESWAEDQLASHLTVFPQGQLTAVDPERDRVVGMAASLIIAWDDYHHLDSWRDFTDRGYFGNHDPTGKTLYGAEIMVDPETRRRGVGSRLYEARRGLVLKYSLRRIRAGSRLRGYRRYAHRWSAGEYVRRVEAGEVKDPTLSFQLNRGFRVFDVVSGYLKGDPESLGWAALIEWLAPPEGSGD